MEVRKILVDASKYSIKCPYAMNAEFIIVHNTANDAPAENEIKYMIRNNNQVSFHFAVDDVEVVQGIPTNRNTWNAGDGSKGRGNRNGISIEICYSKSGGDKFIKAEQNAAKFIASILKEKGWGINKVKKHQDFNGKYCPHRTLDMGWNRFLDMIKSYMNVAPQTTTYKAGQAVNLNKAPLYSNSTTSTIASYKTGTYYLWSAEVIKGRIRITNKASNVGVPGQVTGWISTSSIRK